LVALAVKRLDPSEARTMFGMSAMASGLELGSQTVGIVGLIGDNDHAPIDGGKARLSAGQVVRLPRSQHVDA
jgi:hypothetical protein